MSRKGPRGCVDGAGYTRAPSAEEVEWQLHGACAAHNPELWYSPVRSHIAAAQRICVTECPVLMECRAWALTHHERVGVWGGLSEDDRAAIWKGRPLPKNPRRRRRDAA